MVSDSRGPRQNERLLADLELARANAIAVGVTEYWRDEVRNFISRQLELALISRKRQKVREEIDTDTLTGDMRSFLRRHQVKEEAHRKALIELAEIYAHLIIETLEEDEEDLFEEED